MDRVEDSVKSFFAQRVPRPELRRYVSAIRLVAFSQRVEDSHFPDLGLVAAFHLKGGTRLDGDRSAPQAAVTGLHDRLRRHDHEKGSQILIVEFTAIGAAALLRVPADEMHNETADMPSLSRRLASLSELPEQLSGQPDLETMSALTQARLTALLSEAAPDLLVEQASAKIRSRKGLVRIDQLAREFGLSESAFTRRFRAVVGTAPKRYASIVRVQNVLKIAQTEKAMTRLAQDAGYFDQAHFTREFRAVTGRPPGRVLGAAG